MIEKISKAKFVVTVDTEADDAWTKPGEIKLENMKAIPKFQEMCEKYNVIPTYLITYECATRDEAISVLKPILDRGKCEIGHHLHVWSTPPYQNHDGKGIDLDWIHAYQSELPDSLFYEKAEALKHAIEKNYGVIPKSHRAGRWGIDKRSLEWLMKNDFAVDTSVLPLTDFSRMKGKNGFGPNFFLESFDDSVIKSEGLSLKEIPVTVDNSPFFLIQVLRKLINFDLLNERNAYKIIRKIGGGTKLTPSLDFKLEKYLNLITRKIGQNSIINFSLHSSEVSFGHSPITKTEEGFNYFYNVLENSFRAVNKSVIESSFLSNA